MDHSIAKAIFEEIQNRPYNVITEPGMLENNCLVKGIELIQRLGVLGYSVRGRIGETYWDTDIIPKEIVEMLPPDVPTTHFYVEAFSDDEWHILDPSFQPSFKRLGFPIGSWTLGKCCFDITKLYNQEEMIDYQAKWSDPATQQDYFKRAHKGLSALHKWFEMHGE